MLFTEENIRKVAEMIEEANVSHIVVDPVMFGKMGSALLKEEAMNALKEKLLPLATIMTPNMPEAEQLLGTDQLKSADDLKEAAKSLADLGPKYVLVKGGRLEGPAVDVLFDGKKYYVLEAPRIDTIHTNGAGCSYSAAIAAGLAKGKEVPEAVEEAKKFITAAIRHSIAFKRGVGPTYHAAYRKYGEKEVRVTVE
jgi:pyridoxine kinase/hydroxymethylpyrimidine/phosphomethylpyrimidine kinase